MIIINCTCSNVVFLSNIIKYNRIIIVYILLIMLLTQSNIYKKKSLIVILLLIVSNIITLYITKENDLMLTLLLIICAKNIETKEFIKKGLIVKLIITALVIFCYKIGLAENIVMYREDGLIRNSLGFSHPNRLGMLIFSMCCDLVFLHYNKYSIKDYIVLIVSLIICTKVCDSRSSQIGILALFFMIQYTRIRKEKKDYKAMICIIPILLPILTLILTLMFSKNIQFVTFLNKLVSNRILYCHKFLNYYGLSLFGVFFEFYGQWGISNRLSVLDNAYMHILIHFGIINFVVITYGFIKILKCSVEQKKYEIITYIVPFLFYGLMEHHIYEIQFNSILICLGELIYFKNIKGGIQCLVQEQQMQSEI